jgi:hypothetical protein
MKSKKIKHQYKSNTRKPKSKGGMKMKDGQNGMDEFTDDQLAKALLRIEDTLGRALLPFVLLGDTAKGVMAERLYGNKVELGVETKHLTKEVYSTFNFYEPDRKEHDWGWSFDIDGVPVNIRFITKRYPYFKNKDIRFYRSGEYMLPNPFDEYWKVRGLIK